MEITTLGMILMPIGLLLFFISGRYLYYLFLLTSAFPATAAFNISGGAKFGFQMGYFIGTLWLFRILLSVLRCNITVNVKLIRPLIIFWIVCCVSTIMPFLGQGSVLVHYPKDAWILSPLEPSLSNFTQILYLTFVILVPIGFIIEVRNFPALIRSIQTIFIGGVIVALLGYWQAFGALVGFEYPAELFNNNIGYGLGFNQSSAEGLVGFFRMSSVATEPSMLAGYWMWTIPLLLIQYLSKSIILNISHLGFWILLLFSSLILTVSTTAIVGIFAIFFTSLYCQSYLKGSIAFVKTATLLLLVFILAIVVGFTFLNLVGFNTDIAQFLISDLITDKNSNESGILRLEGFWLGWSIFSQFPVLGVGYGSNRTFDFISTIFSTTGIIGGGLFTIFVLRLLIVLRSIAMTYQYSFDAVKTVALSFFASICCGVTALATANPDIIFLIIWNIFGLSIAFVNIIQRDASSLYPVSASRSK